MSKTTLDFETYNKIRELAHKAVDTAIDEIFTYEGKEQEIEHHYVENSNAFEELIYFGKLRGFRYKDWTDRNKTYVPEFICDYNYPITVHTDNKDKTWWVDLHNMSKDHPAYFNTVSRIMEQPTRLIGA